MRKKIVVTGGAGYIGSHTILELLHEGIEPVSIDNFSNSLPEVNDRIKTIAQKNFLFFNTDLCDSEALKATFSSIGKVDGIIHFAAYKAVGESCENPQKYYYNNITGLVNMLEMARVFRVPSFIFSSSCSVYGNATQLPVTEDTPLESPESPYGHTKILGEQIIRQYARLFPQTSYILLRYFNPVGAHPSGLIGEYPLQKPTNLFPVLTQSASGLNTLTVHGNDYPTPDGTCIRDYVHVCDIARAHVLALNYPSTSEEPEVFNLGTGKGYSVLEVIEAFKKYCKEDFEYQIGPRRKGDVISIYADHRKARKLLGWECQYNLKDMVQTAWKWQQYLNKQQSLSK